MEIVSNSEETHHGDRIARLFRQCDEAILVSPFLFGSFDSWTESIELESLHRLTVVTTMACCGDDQLQKPAALLSLIRSVRRRWPSTKVVIQINNRLHGKVYLFKKSGKIFAGIVTSANLTHSGLFTNHEWGVVVSDPAALQELAAQIRRGIEYPYVSEDVLKVMEQFVDQYRRNHPYESHANNVDASLLNALKLSPIAYAIRGFPKWEDVGKFFLKPIGDKDCPILKVNQEKFGDQQGTLDFPRSPPPVNVRPSDIIIAFGTGDRCVLGVHRVLDTPQERSDAEQAENEDAKRWPWYVFADNFTPRFGNSWWQHAVTIDELAAEFRALHPHIALTFVGGDSLGAFNRGAGRVHVTDEFGRFAAERIFSIEKTLPEVIE